jgi:cytochrome P450 family 4
MWIGSNTPEVRILRCDLAEEILKSKKHIEKSPTYDLLRPWLGEGLITSTGISIGFELKRLIKQI